MSAWCILSCNERSRVCELFLYTHRSVCFVGHAPVVIIGLRRVDGAFMRCIRRYYVARTPRNIHITAAWKGGFAGGQSQRWCTRLRTDRSLNCFVAPSRRNSPVFHFSSRFPRAYRRGNFIVHIPHIRCSIHRQIAIFLGFASNIYDSERNVR